MTLLPTNLERLPNRGIRIEWSDGSADEYTVKDLRDGCPCATCREKRNADTQVTVTPGKMALPILSAEEAKPLEITGMRPVGNYAYNVAFSDGHDSGIFTFEMLKQLLSGDQSDA